jgi:uncharacterized delta-60 repeat protein
MRVFAPTPTVQKGPELKGNERLKRLNRVFSSLAILGFVFFVSVPERTFAQSIVEEWVRRYDGQAFAAEWVAAATVDKAGNLYVTGTTSGGTGKDFLTVKYASDGTETWVRRHGELRDGWDDARAMALDQAGNVFVTGVSEGLGTNKDYVTVKYACDGTELWVRSYNGPENGDDAANALAVDQAGNVFVTGVSEGSDFQTDFATVKYASDGTELWVRRYDGAAGGYDQAFSIAVDPLGDVFVTGESEGDGTLYDYATVKYSSDGTELWVRRYDGPAGDDDRGKSLAVDQAGDVYVTGWSVGVGPRYNCATVKYAGDGTELWVRRYEGPADATSMAYAVAVDQAGNAYVTGGCNENISYNNYLTIKYSSDGTELWVRKYNGPANGTDTALALAVDQAGNVFVTGRSDGGGGNEDYATIKYASDGTELWARRYDGPASGSDVPYALAVDSAGSVYVTGLIVNAAPESDYATVKYSSDGTEAWVTTYGESGSGPTWACAVAVDQAGNVYVSGAAHSRISSNDYVTIKYSQPGRALLRNTEVTELDPPPDLSTILPLDPVADLYISDFQSGDIDPDTAILGDTTHPLVFYGLDRPEAIRLSKTAAGETMIIY